MGIVSEAFKTFLFGYTKTTIQKQEEKIDFIVKAVMLLLQMEGILSFHYYRYTSISMALTIFGLIAVFIIFLSSSNRKRIGQQ